MDLCMYHLSITSYHIFGWFPLGLSTNYVTLREGEGGSEGRLRTGYEKSIFVCYSIRGGSFWAIPRLRAGYGRGGGKKRPKIGLRNLWTAPFFSEKILTSPQTSLRDDIKYECEY